MVSHVYIRMTPLFFDLSKSDAVVGIGLAREGRSPLFLRTTVIKNNIDNIGAQAPSIQILPTNLNL